MKTKTRCAALKAKERADGDREPARSRRQYWREDLGDDKLTTATHQSEKATARQDQARQSCTDDGSGDNDAGNESVRSCPKGKRRAGDCRPGCDPGETESKGRGANNEGIELSAGYRGIGTWETRTGREDQLAWLTAPGRLHRDGVTYNAKKPWPPGGGGPCPSHRSGDPLTFVALPMPLIFAN
jgi:hypothetical protein